MEIEDLCNKIENGGRSDRFTQLNSHVTNLLLFS